MQRILPFSILLALSGATGALYLVAPAPLEAPVVSNPVASGPVSVRIGFDVGAVAESEAVRHIVVTIKAAEAAQRLPVDVGLVVDVSGSMKAEGKLDRAKEAALALAGALKSEDRISLTAFSSGAQALYPLSGYRPLLSNIIAELKASGNTAIYAGLASGLGSLYSSENRVSRLILMTDGQATTGPTDAASMLALLPESVSLSTVGWGSAIARNC
jgi:Mg-chelatase subunit ChlD